jgi:hypothetical protein
MQILIDILGAAGLVAFLFSSIAIGVRCILLSRTTRGFPELVIGIGFLVGAVVGYFPETVVLSTALLPPALEASVLAVTQIAIRGAAIAVLLFTLSVFRPDSVWARAAGGVIVTALCVSWVAFPYTRIYAESPSELLWYDIFAISRSLPLAWGAADSLVYYLKSKRRAKLGLMDPIIANRFLLWGMGLGSMTLLMASTLLASATGIDPTTSGWVLLESSAGMIGAVTLWLTFFPSPSYKALVLRRAAVGMPADVREVAKHG